MMMMIAVFELVDHEDECSVIIIIIIIHAGIFL